MIPLGTGALDSTGYGLIFERSQLQNGLITERSHLRAGAVFDSYLTSIFDSTIFDILFAPRRGAMAMASPKPAKKYKIEMLPIKEPTETEELLLEKIVNQILTAKKSDPKADTTALETEIDQLVYQLYELTAEEIKIIAG